MAPARSRVWMFDENAMRPEAWQMRKTPHINPPVRIVAVHSTPLLVLGLRRTDRTGLRSKPAVDLARYLRAGLWIDREDYAVCDHLRLKVRALRQQRCRVQLALCGPVLGVSPRADVIVQANH